MSRLKKSCSMMMVAVMLAAPTFIMASPIALKAQSRSDKARYAECIDAADKDFKYCLKHAEETDILCWAKYGYDKIGCTVSYIIRSIF